MIVAGVPRLTPWAIILRPSGALIIVFVSWPWADRCYKTIAVLLLEPNIMLDQSFGIMAVLFRNATARFTNSQERGIRFHPIPPR